MEFLVLRATAAPPTSAQITETLLLLRHELDQRVPTMFFHMLAKTNPTKRGWFQRTPKVRGFAMEIQDRALL